MKKILLATTALFGLAVAGAAQAATSPLTVNVGGSVDVLAGKFHEAQANTSPRTSTDFETLYSLTFGVKGKAASGVEYGADLGLDNMPDISNAFGATSASSTGNTLTISTANIHMSGAFGKVVVGDSHGATDLALMAPVVGEGQVFGRYMDFLDTVTFAKTFIAGVDVTDHSTNITYFTPKVGNENHKVQAGITYVPQFYDYGSNTTLYKTNNTANSLVFGNAKDLSPYQDVVKGAVAYTGNLSPVTVGLSANVITGTSSNKSGSAVSANATSNYMWLLTAPSTQARDFTSWGLGAQAAYEGFTLGGGYTDLGHYNTVAGQTKSQHTYNAGLKYEFSKVAVGVSYLGGEGYDNTLGTGGSTAVGGTAPTVAANYVKDFNSYGVGGSYTWAPGLTTNADAVLFDQKTQEGVKNDGYVLLLSQKLAF